jgi:membrane protease subunit HflC
MAEATSKDPQFFAFWRSLSAYREALRPENTTYVLSPDSEFFKYFGAGK